MKEIIYARKMYQHPYNLIYKILHYYYAWKEVR